MSMTFDNPREYLAGQAFPPMPRLTKLDLALPSSKVTHFVQCERTTLIMHLDNGWQVQMSGVLRAAFVCSPGPDVSMHGGKEDGGEGDDSLACEGGLRLRLELFDFIANHHSSFVGHASLSASMKEEKIPVNIVRGILVAHGMSTASANSADTTSQAVKNEQQGKKKKRESNDDQDSSSPSDENGSRFSFQVSKVVVPKCPVNEYGLTLHAMRCLEVRK